MSELAKAYVQIIPSAKGIQGALSNVLDGEAEKAGMSAGGILGGAVGKGLKLAGAAITAATGAVVAFGKSSIDAGMSFDSSMSQVAATMGLTMDQMANQVGTVDLAWGTFNGNLREYAQEMGAHTAFSASQAADALNYMALAGYDAQTSMEMLPNVLNLAAAGGMELATASDMVTDASSALGLSIDETALMVDKMALASSKTNTSVAQLGDAILTVGGNAKSLSGGTTELAQVLGLMADNGIKGAEAGTHLRNIMLSLTPKSEAAAAAMESLGFNAYDANGELRPLEDTFQDLASALDGMSTEERTNMLSAMFNKTDLAAVNALLATDAERWETVAAAIDGAWYTSEALTKSFDKAGLSMTTMESDLSKLGISGETFNSIFDQSSGNAENLADSLWEAADAGVSYDDIVNALGGDLDVLQGAFNETTGAAQAMADTQLDNLQGDITLFQSALEGLQIAFSDKLTPTFRDFVQFGADGLSRLTEAFNEGGFSGAMEAFGEILSDGLNMIMEKLPTMVDAGMKLLGALGEGIINNLPRIAEIAVQIIVNLANAIIQALPNLIPSAVGTISTLVDGILGNIDLIIDTAITLVISLADALLNNVDKLIEAAIKLVVGLTDAIMNALPRLLEKAPIIISKLVAAIIKEVPQLLKAAVEIIAKLASGLLASVGRLLTAGYDIIRQLFNGILNAISNFSSIGTNIVQGIKNGISNAWNNMVSWFKGLFGDLIQIAKDILGIASPSKVFEQIGEYTTEGFDKGMENFGQGAMEDVQNAMDEISNIPGPTIGLSDMTVGSATMSGAIPVQTSANGDVMSTLQTIVSLLQNGSNVNVTLEGDAQGLFRQVRKEVNQFTKSTGNSPFIAPA